MDSEHRYEPDEATEVSPEETWQDVNITMSGCPGVEAVEDEHAQGEQVNGQGQA